MYSNSKYLLLFIERKRCLHSDLRAQLLNAASKGRKMKSGTEKERDRGERATCIHQKGKNRWKGRVFVCSLFDMADKTAAASASALCADS